MVERDQFDANWGNLPTISETGKRAVARALTENADAIEAEIVSQAMVLIKETYELIRKMDANRKRKPPCTISLRRGPAAFTTKFVWVTYTASKRTTPEGARLRFTTEVRGRKNGKYPNSTFRGFPIELRERLIEIEGEFAKLRQSMTYWRNLHTDMVKLLKE